MYEINKKCIKSDLEQLLLFGGFPEPFLKANKRHWMRWQNERQSRVIQEDLLSLEYIREVSRLNLLLQVLPDKVGSMLSINKLAQSLSVAFETVDCWITILENLYFCFRVSPYGLSKLRTAKKEKKLYMWDWSVCQNELARFENIVASHLLKKCHATEDAEGYKMELSFIRDSQGRELDFVVIKNEKLLFAVECKTGEQGLSKNISYFSKRTDIPYFYQVHLGTKDYEMREYKARVLPFITFAEIIKL